MTVKASLVKELRERSKAGMMECKRALVESNGDIELAYTALRKAGIVKASKKSGRIAAEGIIVTKLSDDKHSASMVEVNCETDFVAKSDQFIAFVKEVASITLRVGCDGYLRSRVDASASPT